VSAGERTTPGGLCDRCRHARRVDSPRASYLRCGRSDGDPAFPRYPHLPVVACAGFEGRSPAARRDGVDPGGRQR
jgi:hypothetical protein